jgi:hypothetical protein
MLPFGASTHGAQKRPVRPEAGQRQHEIGIDPLIAVLALNRYLVRLNGDDARAKAKINPPLGDEAVEDRPHPNLNIVRYQFAPVDDGHLRPDPHEFQRRVDCGVASSYYGDVGARVWMRLAEKMRPFICNFITSK